ncbi:MAG TPA: GNAT family N-acetyltransferase [Candidatus Nanopelagicales bacterium]|nr:GNAT family N-acetyltransferase [Candidatus Nanopelagicales bacterium]
MRTAIRAELAEAASVDSRVALMPDDLRAVLGVRTGRVAGGLAIRMSTAPDVGYFNRTFAIGLESPVTEGQLREVIAFQAAAGGAVACVQIPPFAEVPAAVEALEHVGFRRAERWAKLLRPTSEPEAAVVTDLVVARVSPEEADEFGRVQSAAMDLPRGMVPWCAAQVTAEGWTGYAAFDGDRMVAVACLFATGDVAQLAGAATLPEARGRGAQSALLARRIADARDAGLRWIAAETDAASADGPSTSLRNLHRAGFELLYERQNWVVDLPPVA